MFGYTSKNVRCFVHMHFSFTLEGVEEVEPLSGGVVESGIPKLLVSDVAL